MERGIGERRDQEFLEPGVEIDLVLDPWAGDDELIALRGGGGNFVCELHGGLRVVGLDLVDAQDGDFLVRESEGIHAMVERLDHQLVVASLPGRDLHVLRGLRRLERGCGFVQPILQPAPQPYLVDIGIDGPALRPDSRACELVGAGRDLGERAVHQSLDLGHRGANVGRAAHITGRIRLFGHRLQFVVDARGAVAEIVALNRIGRAADVGEQLERLRIDLLGVLAQEEVAAKVEFLPVKPLPIAERIEGIIELVPLGPGFGDIEGRGLAWRG